MISVLCVHPRSNYKQYPELDCWDHNRDALKYQGDNPLIAHPPCRLFSRHCRQQSTAPPEEKQIAYHCVDLVKRNGGILEHPAGSHLWSEKSLPNPGDRTDPDFFCLEVWQAWWGYPCRKATWLLFSRIAWDNIEIPFQLHNPGFDRRAVQLMSKSQRSETVPALIEWLVDLVGTVAPR